MLNALHIRVLSELSTGEIFPYYHVVFNNISRHIDMGT